MSHSDDEKHDFDKLKDTKPEASEPKKQAQIEARGIINRLEPLHIDGWADLLTKVVGAAAG